MNYYLYRLIFHANENNHILKCRRLFHQYTVDMYAKVETERLTFIRYKQIKLRCRVYSPSRCYHCWKKRTECRPNYDSLRNKHRKSSSTYARIRTRYHNVRLTLWLTKFFYRVHVQSSVDINPKKLIFRQIIHRSPWHNHGSFRAEIEIIDGFHCEAWCVRRDALLDVFSVVAETRIVKRIYFHLVDREDKIKLNWWCDISRNFQWRRWSRIVRCFY